MFYDFAITIPANTPKAAPYRQKLKLSAGIITRVEIGFPHGLWGHVHAVLEHDGHQWLPSNPDGNFASSGYTIVIDESYRIDEGNNIVDFVGWSSSDTYDHTITVRVGILGVDMAQAINNLAAAVYQLMGLMGGTQ